MASMALAWTRERIEALSDSGLSSLYTNARQRGNSAVVELCEAILGERQRQRELSVSTARRYKGSALEERIARELGDFARSLGERFDLSVETAARNRTKRPHQLLGNDGKAKNANQINLRALAFRRYISYRLRDTKITLAVTLERGKSEADLRYWIHGTTDIVKGGSHNVAIDLDRMETAIEFSNLQSATTEYGRLIATFAIKRNLDEIM